MFAAAGLPALTTPDAFVRQLQKLPQDMLATIAIDDALSAQIMAGAVDATKSLEALAAALRAASIASAVPIVTTGDKICLVLSVMGLPEVGVTLTDRRTSGFRWYVVPLGGQAAARATGSTTELKWSTSGPVALVCLGYTRQGLADPYEAKIDLPKDAVLSFKQYEFLMNTLEELCPIGVGIDTYAIRRDHVDIDGDGKAEPLRPAVSRTYRAFRKPKLRGIYEDQV